MSAEVTSARPRRAARDVARVESTLAEADSLLETTFVELRESLVRAADGRAPPRPGPSPNPAPSASTSWASSPTARATTASASVRCSPTGAGPSPAAATTPTRTSCGSPAALELLHLFALIQDDVMDRSDSRRGRPTLHVVAAERHRRAGGLGDAPLFGDSVATLVSDLALSEATLLIASTPPPVRGAWRLMAVELVEGQLLDVTHTAGRRRDLPTSRRIARFKSGRYTITRPLQLGALVARRRPRARARARRVGRPRRGRLRGA